MISRISTRRHWWRSRCLVRDDDGAALLEMTVVTPFLIILGFGIFEFSNALYQYHLITAGIRDSARYAAGVGNLDDDENGPPHRDETVRTDAKKIAVYGSITGTEKRVEWWDIDQIGVRYCIKGVEEGDAQPACPCDDSLGLYGGTNKVCVSTTVTYDGLGFLTSLGLEPITITTAHEERYFGVR